MSVNPKDPRLDEPLSSFSLTDATQVAKAMVHPDLASFITPEVIKPTHEHKVRSQYPIRICKNYFEQAAKAEKNKQSMDTWDFYFLGARDILTAKTDFDINKVNGQRALCYRLDTGQLQEATVWGSGPGDEGSKRNIPFWHVVTGKVMENEFKYQSGEVGVGFTLSYIDRAEPLSPEVIINQVSKLAKPVSALDKDSDLYQPVVIIGKLGAFKPLEEWEETGDLVPVYDANRNPVIDPKTNQPRMRAERVPSAEGQPFIQPRIDNPELSLYTFQASLKPIDDDDKSENRFRFRMLNKKLGNHFVDLPMISQIFSDAMKLGMGTSEDAVEHLTGTYAGTEVLVAGIITRFVRDEERQLNWIDMEATLCVPLDSTQIGTVEQVVTTSTPTAAPTPAPTTETPEIVAETAPAPTPAPAPAPAPAGQPNMVDQLKKIVLEGRELYGPAMTINELQSLRLLPDYMVDSNGALLPEHTKLVERVIGIVSQEKGDSPVGSFGSTSPPVSSVNIEPAPAGTAAPELQPMTCNKCGKALKPEEVLSHPAVCPGKPSE